MADANGESRFEGWDDFQPGDRVRTLRDHPGFEMDADGKSSVPAGHMGTVTEEQDQRSGRPCMGIMWDALADGTVPAGGSVPFCWPQAVDPDPEVFVLELVRP